MASRKRRKNRDVAARDAPAEDQLTEEEFREVVEVFAILRRWWDEENKREGRDPGVGPDDAPRLPEGGGQR